MCLCLPARCRRDCAALDLQLLHVKVLACAGVRRCLRSISPLTATGSWPPPTTSCAWFPPSSECAALLPVLLLLLLLLPLLLPLLLLCLLLGYRYQHWATHQLTQQLAGRWLLSAAGLLAARLSLCSSPLSYSVGSHCRSAVTADIPACCVIPHVAQAARGYQDRETQLTRCCCAQTACGLRNGFEYTVGLQMESAALKLVLHEGDQRLVHNSEQGVQAFSKAHFDWVTATGTKERHIVVRAHRQLSGLALAQLYRVVRPARA